MHTIGLEAGLRLLMLGGIAQYDEAVDNDVLREAE
jgi:hypothetical protein